MADSYDFIIVGGGPAGYSAAVYAARFRLKTLVIARNPGGTIINTHIVENWPGEKSLSGFELMEKLKAHVGHNGVEILMDSVDDISNEKGAKGFTLKTEGGKTYRAKAILIATGSAHRRLGVPGEKELAGRGVSYCATCDAAFFRDKVVAVVGGSDSAAKEALLLTEYAKKVFIIYRKEKIRAEPINAERVDKNKKIEIISNTKVTKVNGEMKLESVTLDKAYKGSKEFPLDGLFIEIGYVPQSKLAEAHGVKLNKKGEIITGKHGCTNVDGVFAAGDVTDMGFKQAITAAAQGASAAMSAYEYIGGKKIEC